jgi:hypothetical protein
MSLSSSFEHRDLGWFLVEGVVAEHCPEDVDASLGESEQRLFVAFPFAALSIVEGSGGWAVLQA